MVILLGMMVAAWIIDGVFVFRVWPEGITALQSVLNQEYARTFDLECVCGDLPRFAAATADFLYSTIFRATGIHEMGLRFADEAVLSIPDTVVRNFYLANFEWIQVVMLSTQLLGVRIAMLLMMVPMLGLIYGVAMADGLVQRAVRRVCGGRESGSIYHRAKHFEMIGLTGPAALFLLSPSSLDPQVIGAIASVITVILVRLQWSYYKKHL